MTEALRAQAPVVIHGRIEDAVTRAPVAGARVSSADSSSVAFADAQGVFAVQIPPGVPLSLQVEQFGYLAAYFELPVGSPERISVLLLEPAPIELAGVDVVAESDIDRVLSDMRRTRNAYQGAVNFYDRSAIERFASGGTVWDFIRLRVPGMFECATGRSGLCVTGRSRSFQTPFPELPVRICLDGRESWLAVGELTALDIQSVSMVEIFGRGRGGIRIYTPWYLTSVASRGGVAGTPVEFGC